MQSIDSQQPEGRSVFQQPKELKEQGSESVILLLETIAEEQEISYLVFLRHERDLEAENGSPVLLDDKRVESSQFIVEDHHPLSCLTPINSDWGRNPRRFHTCKLGKAVALRKNNYK